mgnify:CR=1 FL=1|jgi:hypothetical protein|tara:strand:- start:279 stop:860 length:582 start_codon:yes stop_codon:yes gene_type:complete
MKYGWNKEMFDHLVGIKIHNLLKMDEEYIQPLHNKLLDIIINTGDKQNKSSNVKADMTDWDMHTKYEDFETLGKIVKVLLVQDTLPTNKNEPIETKHKYNIREMWGAVYRKGNYTIKHWHWPCTWSFGYYLKTSENTPPIVFNNVVRDTKIGSLNYYPKIGDLVMFPSEIYHEVPIQETNEERIMIAGNLQAV